MTYIQKTLVAGEQIKYAANIHWWIMVPPVAFGVLGVIIGQLLSMVPGALILFLSILHIIKSLMYMYTTELVITNKRIVAKFGWISRTTFEVKTSRIEGVQVHQGIIGRILGFGTVHVLGIGGSTVPVPLIKEPLRFKEIADQIPVRGHAEN